MLKFRHSEKTTKSWPIFHFLFELTPPRPSEIGIDTQLEGKGEASFDIIYYAKPWGKYEEKLAQPIQPNSLNYGWIGYDSYLVDPKGHPWFSSYFQNGFVS